MAGRGRAGVVELRADPQPQPALHGADPRTTGGRGRRRPGRHRRGRRAHARPGAGDRLPVLLQAGRKEAPPPTPSSLPWGRCAARPSAPPTSSAAPPPHGAAAERGSRLASLGPPSPSQGRGIPGPMVGVMEGLGVEGRPSWTIRSDDARDPARRRRHRLRPDARRLAGLTMMVSVLLLPRAGPWGSRGPMVGWRGLGGEG